MPTDSEPLPPPPPHRVPNHPARKPGWFARAREWFRSKAEQAQEVANANVTAEFTVGTLGVIRKTLDDTASSLEDERLYSAGLERELHTMRREKAELEATVSVRTKEVAELSTALAHSQARWAAQLACEIAREAKAGQGTGSEI